MSEQLFEVTDLHFGYGPAPLFAGLSFAVQAGDYWLVTGPSGSGKSTLLRLLCRLEELQGGQILFRGRPLASWEPPQLRRQVAYLPQSPVVSPGSVRDNLLLPLRYKVNRDLPRPDDPALRQALAEVLLADLSLEQSAAELSLGQKQRLCLLRTLLLGPRVLLMDEPTSALDEKSAQTVYERTAKLGPGVAVLLVTHGQPPALPLHAQKLTLGSSAAEASA